MAKCFVKKTKESIIEYLREWYGIEIDIEIKGLDEKNSERGLGI